MEYVPSLVGLIADDLTSAADGAGPFVSCGLSAQVAMDGPEMSGDATVLAIDTDSRAMPVDKAVRAVEETARALAGCRWLYKTIDSTLRGHAKQEIAAALRGSGRQHVLFAPAFPAAGRITRGGIQFVNGQRVTESPFAGDPVHRIHSDRLADFRSELAGTWISPDAATQGDLDAAMRAVTSPETTLIIGSPGIAQALAGRVAADHPGLRSRVPEPGLPRPGRALVVVGSANPVSRAQAAALTGLARVDLIAAPDARQPDPRGVLAGVAAAAARALENPDISVLIATGGETMRAVLQAIGSGTIHLLGELEPGFPHGLVSGPGGRLLRIAMKAGGFGGSDSLRRAANRLLEGSDG